MKYELEVINGKLSACSSCSSICEYQCCKQQRPLIERRVDPSNSVLLFPCEFELASYDRRNHIDITANEFHGGKLGFCNPRKINQSLCDPDKNFKPLDCVSYPFFPFFDGETLGLLRSIDCPLSIQNEPNFAQHYSNVYRMWKLLIDENPTVKSWIKSFKLDNYQPYVLESQERTNG